MSRGHVQGFDSNAGQFERMGNPWTGEPMTRKERRRARKGIRPCRPGLPRLVERASREGDERITELNYWAGFDQRRGARARTLVTPEKSPTLAKPEPLTRELRPARDTELTPNQRIKSRWQRFEFRAKAAVAEAAYLASERHRAEERRLIERRIEALQSRLEQI